MKKIGILTFHRSVNYGAFMQCYALVTKLKERHPDCEIEVIDYTRKFTLENYRKSRFKNIIRNPLTIFDVISRKRIFNEYLKLLPLSDYRVDSDNVEEIFSKIKGRYDAVVVGSDIVFGIHKGAPFPTAYWLNDDLGCAKLSYAASSNNTDYENLSETVKGYCKKALSDFDYIGVRDECTEGLVKYLGEGLNAEHNCDPTVFFNMDSISVNMDELNKIVYKKIDSKKPIIGVMANSPRVIKLLKERYSDRYNIVSVYARNEYADDSIYKLDIFQWAKAFSLFDMTVSTFFHGTLFSLKNGTPVICINNKKVNEKYVGKVEDLLTRLDITENFFHESEILKDSKEFFEQCDRILAGVDRESVKELLKKEEQYFEKFDERLTEILSK